MSKALPRDAVLGDFLALLKPVPPKEVLNKMARTDAEIERIKAEALESAYADGHAKGYAKGTETGYQEGTKLGHEYGFKAAHDEAAKNLREEFDRLHAELERTVLKVDDALTEWFLKSEPGLSQLAILIAQRIVAKELSTSHEAIVAMTKEAISEVTHATQARIKINPFDSETLEAHRAEIQAAAHSVRDLEFVEDQNVVGGCVIETDGGVVDASIDMKFREILESIRRAA